MCVFLKARDCSLRSHAASTLLQGLPGAHPTLVLSSLTEQRGCRGLRRGEQEQRLESSPPFSPQLGLCLISRNSGMWP